MDTVPRKQKMTGIEIGVGVVVVALVGALSGIGGHKLGQNKGAAEVEKARADQEEARADQEEADARAIEAVADGTQRAVSAALEPVMADLDMKTSVLLMEPAFCKDAHYDALACLVDRCWQHAALGTSGAAIDCNVLVNVVATRETVTIVESPIPGAPDEPAPDAVQTWRKALAGSRK